MANVRVCDRCRRPVVLITGIPEHGPLNTGATDPMPTIEFAMPYNPETGMSERRAYQVCVDCYDLIKRACGFESNPDLIEGWKRLEGHFRKPPRLPEIRFDDNPPPALPDEFKELDI